MAPIHGQTRASLRALGNPAACEPECSQALTPSLRNSIRRALKEATQKRLTNGSPSATVVSPRLCESRILDASESSCERRRVASRSLAHPKLQHLGCPTLLQWSSLENQALTSHRAFLWKKSSKRPGLSRASRPSTPKAARRSPANVSQELVVDHLEELSSRLSQLETTEKGAFASASAQLGFSQKARGSSIAGGLTVPSVLGRSATSLSGPAACARARALLGSGCTIRSPPFLSDHRPRRPPQTSQPDPENETASLGGALLCVASALEQKHDSSGTVHDAFGPNPGVANSQVEYDAIFGDRSSRESSGPARLGGQALTARVVRTRKERPEGSRGVSRKQGAQGFDRPRRRSMVLAQTRRCLPVAAVRQLPQPHAVRRQ